MLVYQECVPKITLVSTRWHYEKDVIFRLGIEQYVNCSCMFRNFTLSKYWNMALRQFSIKSWFGWLHIRVCYQLILPRIWHSSFIIQQPVWWFSKLLQSLKDVCVVTVLQFLKNLLLLRLEYKSHCIRRHARLFIRKLFVLQDMQYHFMKDQAVIQNTPTLYWCENDIIFSLK